MFSKFTTLKALAFGIGCAVIYGLGPQFQKLQDYQNTGDYTPAPKAARAFYNGLHRLAWSGVLSWVIFACTKGLGGPVDTFLSWRAWAPLARMSYCMYLVHIVTISYFLSLPRFLNLNFTINPNNFSAFSYTVTIAHPMIIYFLLWILSVSAALSYVCVICFEMPIAHLEKLLFSSLGLAKLPSVQYIHEIKKE